MNLRRKLSRMNQKIEYLQKGHGLKIGDNFFDWGFST